MRNFYRLCILLILIGSGYTAFSSHLVGGEISYRCLGNHQYEIRLVVYRDCFSGNIGFDALGVITVRDQNDSLISNAELPLRGEKFLPRTAPTNCSSLPTNVCTARGVYLDTVYLPPKAGGYVISHQRCCRNYTITNVNNSGQSWGSTYTTSIPPNDSSCNSSLRFNDDPPILLCLKRKVELDFSASEPDGDSIYYELCNVLHGGGNGNPNNYPPNHPLSPRPNPAAPPPYIVIPFNSGFSKNYPISSSGPAFSIDPQTGILSGRPTAVGQFVFAVCAREYRNGVLLSTTRRDFQFNVSADCKSTMAVIADQAINKANICNGREISFENLSQNAQDYFWDFGDTLITTDTSRLEEPVYSYNDTGRYMVMLVAEPYTDCADTSFQLFHVYDSTTVRYSYSGDLCLSGSGVNFHVSGHFSTKASFHWYFDHFTNLGDSAQVKEPLGVIFNQPGLYRVSVTVDDGYCSETYSDSIRIYPPPQIKDVVDRAEGCVPYTVQFLDQSTASTSLSHLWTFGDGSISFDASPVHRYESPGIYSVTHTIKTSSGCLDSARNEYRDVITVRPRPYSSFQLSPKETSIYSPVVKFQNRSENLLRSETIISDGRRFENLVEEAISFNDTGFYYFTHVSYNRFGCSDTLVDTVRIGSPFTLNVPNAFSPNGDGINDEFFFTVTNARDIIFEVYDRWGERVFRTSDASSSWNGRINNKGKLLQGGVYSYVLIVRVKEVAYDHRQLGYITLIR